MKDDNSVFPAHLIHQRKENPRLPAAAEGLKERGIKVGDAVSEALKTMANSLARHAYPGRAPAAVSSTIASTTEPIPARRQMRLAKAGKAGRIKTRVVADPEHAISDSISKRPRLPSEQIRLRRAGGALVLHASSPRQLRWQQLRETNSILRRVATLQEAYQESENPVVLSLRSVTSTVASWFDENETARVLRSMKLLDPSLPIWSLSFEREPREYIVPEVVDTYLSADNEALNCWCSDAVRGGVALNNVLWATMEQSPWQGLVPDSQVLDIRQVDVSTGCFPEDCTPVYAITFTTQEVLLFRDRKTRDVVIGAEDRVEQCNYAAVVTRVEEELENELTGG
ncbi:hypothetical protein F5148DRAFT_1274270 [Russula earlei]|uniref:Uncharacterized protein n=1 Tax=Russula earlei TaxID=71964 RepID=A0ACC0UI31_9AGAM|nr:hypothetical protein F5148DRAFT_1274270 [Russula earlei]